MLLRLAILKFWEKADYLINLLLLRLNSLVKLLKEELKLLVKFLISINRFIGGACVLTA